MSITVEIARAEYAAAREAYQAAVKSESADHIPGHARHNDALAERTYNLCNKMIRAQRVLAVAEGTAPEWVREMLARQAG